MRVRTICIIACFLAASDWLGCRLLNRRVHQAFYHWVTVMTDQGWTVHTGAVTEDGLPFGARVTVRDLTLAGGRAVVPGGIDLRSDRLVLSLALLDPIRLNIEPQGPLRLRLASLPPIAFEADQMRASVALWRTPIDSIRIRAASLAGGLMKSDNHQAVRIGDMRLHLTAARGFSARTTANLTVDASNLQLPDDGRWPLGATIGHMGFDVSLASPALSGQGADQARAWRDWGGALSLQRLDVRWGPLRLATTAHLGLDGNLQPAGGGTARVGGWAPSLDALARGGAISQGVAQTAKAVLSLMAAPDQTAASSDLKLPFTLRDSTLSVGKVPLMRLNPVNWGGV